MPLVHGCILTMTGSVVFLTFVHLTRTASIMGHLSDTQENATSDSQTGGASWGPSPFFVRTESVVRVAPSNMAILPCSVNFLGDRQVVWRRVQEDEFLTIGKMVWSKDPRILVEHRVSEGGISSWDLLMRNIQYNDAGVYECQVTSSEKVVWNVELKVIDPVTSKPKSRVNKQATHAPHVMATKRTADHQRSTWRKQVLVIDHEDSPKKDEFLTAGQPVRLVCNTTLTNMSLPTTSHIEWYKDGESIESNQQVLLTRYQLEADQTYLSELIIDKSKLSDSGNYLCRFKNTNLLLARVYVLPNTTINSANQEDQSQFYAGDGLEKGTSAASTRQAPHGWSLALLYLIQALVAISQLSSRASENSAACSVHILHNENLTSSRVQLLHHENSTLCCVHKKLHENSTSCVQT